MLETAPLVRNHESLANSNARTLEIAVTVAMDAVQELFPEMVADEQSKDTVAAIVTSTINRKINVV